MARSCGGGSRGGGSRGGSRSGGGSRPSTSRRYSSHYRYRHAYVDRRGRSRVYYSEKPLDYSKTPEEYNRRLFKKNIYVFVIYIFMFIILFGSTYTNVVQSSSPIKAYKDNSIVLQDVADVFSPQEEAELEKELRLFGEKTGIVPFLYTAKDMSIDGFTHYDVEQYAMEQYYRFFRDENHYLVVFVDELDWKWWAVQGDNTYPLLDDDEFSVFRKNLQSELYRQQPFAEAFKTAFSGFGDYITEGNTASVGILLFFYALFLIPTVLSSAISMVSSSRKYKEEYEYYQDHGLPIEAHKILDKCSSCGANNPEKHECCEYCGSNMIIS